MADHFLVGSTSQGLRVPKKRMPMKESSHGRTKRAFVAAVLAFAFVPGMFIVRGDDKRDDEETLRSAATLLRAMMNGGAVPQEVLAKADCVLVLPGVKKFGIGIGGSGGRGPMSCRRGVNFRGPWSAPAMYGMGGVSIGLQIGGASSDFVVLVMSRKAVDTLMNGKTKLGRDATAAAGPSGATAATTSSDVLTYGRAKGLFAGVSMGTATLSPDNDANERLYNGAISAREILLSNNVATPLAGQAFVSTLGSAAGMR